MVNIVGISLMVISNAVSWLTVVKSSGSVEELRSEVWKIALFYASWALYNRFTTVPRELGHVSFGTLLGMSLANLGRIPLVLANLLVTLNFAGVIPMIIKAGGPFSFALKARKKKNKNVSDAMLALWGYVFTAYIFSNTVLWIYSAYLTATLP